MAYDSKDLAPFPEGVYEVETQLIELQTIVKEFQENLLAINGAFKELNRLKEKKEQKGFINEIEKRKLFRSSIRSCLSKLVELKKEYDKKIKKLMDQKKLSDHYKVLSKMRMPSHYDKNELAKGTDSNRYILLRDYPLIKEWVGIYGDMFLRSGEEKRWEYVGVYVKDLIANLSAGGKFVKLAKEEKWDEINLKKQGEEIISLYNLIQYPVAGGANRLLEIIKKVGEAQKRYEKENRRR